jgi:hypothetical protein
LRPTIQIETIATHSHLSQHADGNRSPSWDSQHVHLATVAG